MADEEQVEDPGEMIRFIRWFRKWSQPKLSRRTGIDKSQLSRYEAGEEVPRPAQLQRIATAGKVPLRVWGYIRYCLQLIRQAIAAEAAFRHRRAARPAETKRPVPRSGGRWTGRSPGPRGAGAPARRPSLRSAEPADGGGHRASGFTRGEAEKKQLEAKRRLLIEGAPSFRDWVVCLRLCAASERAATDDPAEALALAELALFISARGPGTAAWRSRLAGYCTVFISNAQKVSGELRQADAAIASAWRLWKAGKDEEGLLSEASLLDREASLRAVQRRFADALKLHEAALARARPADQGYFLLTKSVTLGEMGDNEGSLSALEQAAREIDAKRQPRLLCVLRFNHAANLLRLHRAEEAAPIVKEVRRLVDRLGNNDLDLIRTRWLEGNLCAGLGRNEEAVAALEEVRRALRKMPFDHALASLDLALVYREEGRWAEVQELAADLVKTFTALEVHREAIAALVLFRDAAERGAVTAELVRRLQDYLAKARVNPKLRFPA